MTESPVPSSARLDPTDKLTERLAAYRAVREQIERSVLPLATSVDGVAFEVQASLYGLSLRRGGYVVLESNGDRRLGQVTELDEDAQDADVTGLVGASIRIRLARGIGTVLETDGAPFHDARVRPAEPAEVEQWVRRGRPERAGLGIGELLLAPGVPALLDSGGLDRHTFLCGQSGSGKTYSLGVLLERVLAETSLPVVVLDPNSDFVGLGEVRPDADPAASARYTQAAAHVSVWSDDASETQHPLRLRFADLQPATRAAVLGLDPVRDREEYRVLDELLRLQQPGQPLDTRVEDLLTDPTPGARELGLRAANLGVLDWKVWSPDLRSVVDEVREPTARCTIIDLGSLDTVQEQHLVAEAVLSALWEVRLQRRPRLVVIDEAHNVAPADPTDALTRLSSERAIQIAAEGRKYGIYLLTSTQRPHKVHENVVSQCDNLLLMRMNSQTDVADLSRLFSFVPPGLMAGATSFGLGEALVAGKVLRQPAYVRMGRRVTREGGADVPVTWAVPRPRSAVGS